MRTRKNLNDKLIAIRESLTEREKVMFSRLDEYIRSMADELIGCVTGILAKSKYRILMDKNATIREVRRVMNDLMREPILYQAQDIIKRNELKIIDYITNENVNVFKIDMKKIADTFNELNVFDVKYDIKEVDISEIRNMCLSGFPLKYYIQSSVSQLYMKLMRSVRMNIASAKREVLSNIIEDLKIGIDTFRGQVRMIFYNFNSMASNQSFKQLMNGLKEL